MLALFNSNNWAIKLLWFLRMIYLLFFVITNAIVINIIINIIVDVFVFFYY